MSKTIAQEAVLGTFIAVLSISNNLSAPNNIGRPTTEILAVINVDITSKVRLGTPA
nr:hypothetical protein [Clostridium rectalis]